MKNSNRYLWILIGSLLPATTAFAVPSLSIPNTSAAPGTAVNITVNMTADAVLPVSSLQFDIPLPTGFTFVSVSTGTATLAAGKSVSASVLSGSVRTLIFGINQTAIGSGSIAIIQLNLASTLTPGSSTLNITNVVASDANGNAVGSTVTAGSVNVLDIAAPSAPANLTAVAVSSTQINLAWAASTDNLAVAGYRILRGGVFLTSSTATSFTNSGLTPSTLYSYTVAAYDAAGNISTASAAASATTLSAPDNTAPTTPTNVAAVAVSSTHMSVSWTASTDNVGVTGYQVFRGGLQISTVTTGTSFANSGLTPLTNYSYFIRAFDAAGNISSASTSVSATTLADRCDLNADGSVNAVDLQNMTNAILLGNNPAAYDLNRDLVVNVVDIQLLVNVILATGSCPQ